MEGLEVAIIAVAFYIAWNMGSNDSANAMGTAVGSGILSFHQATLTIAIFVLLGAYLRGYGVMKTVGKGIVPPAYLTLEMARIALLSAGIWVTIATIKGLPVSTTQSIVGGCYRCRPRHPRTGELVHAPQDSFCLGSLSRTLGGSLR